MMKKILVGAAAVAILASGAFAATINSDPGMYAIGTLGGAGGTQYSNSYAIDVSDGKVYIAGESWSPTWSANHPYIGVVDSSVPSIIEIPNPAGVAGKAQGVSVALASGQIAAGGTIGGIGRSYIAPLNNIAGGAWSTMYGSDAQCEGMNVNRTSETENDRTEVVGRNTKNNRGLRVRMAVGPWSTSVGEYLPGAGGTKVKALSISTNRTMYGQEEGTPRSSDAVYTSGINTSVTRVPMANPNERSLAYGISENAQYMCGMQYNTAASWVYDAFVWDTSDASATILPVSTLWEVNPAAYAVNSQGIVAGRGYNSIDGEVAGLWMSKTSELVTLADLAASYGIDMSDWTVLKRAYAISDVQDDGKFAVSGYGTWAADGTSRAFVLVVPEPATLSFLALGGLALLRRRR